MIMKMPICCCTGILKCAEHHGDKLLLVLECGVWWLYLLKEQVKNQ